MLGEEYNACSSALGNFLHSPVISSLLAPNIFLSTLFSNTLNLCSSLKVRDRGLSKGFVTVSFFLRWGVVNPLTNPQAGGPPLRLSATAYSIFSQLPSISGGRLPYKTIILPVVLYGCETWSLTLREEHRLRVFENKVLRKIFGAKRDEITGEWRKLHNAELYCILRLT